MVPGTGAAVAGFGPPSCASFRCRISSCLCLRVLETQDLSEPCSDHASDAAAGAGLVECRGMVAPRHDPSPYLACYRRVGIDHCDDCDWWCCDPTFDPMKTGL